MKESQKTSKEEIVKSYNEIHASTNRLLETLSFYRWVLKKLDTEPGAELLDIATGLGRLLEVANEFGLWGYGVDISIKAVERARAEHNQSCICVGDGETLPFKDSSFDYVTNLGSLEHFLDIRAGVKEMCRVLKRNGLAAVFLPNSYYLVDIIRDVWWRGYGPSHGQIVERFATKLEWRDILVANGLTVIQTYKYNFFFPKNKLDWQAIKSHPYRILRPLIAPLIPFNLSYSFLFICKRD